MVNFIFALIGLLAGGVINVLADDMPQRARLQMPHCPRCHHVYAPGQWLGIGRRLWGGGQCPQCGLPERRRTWLVELGTAVLFAFLPFFIAPWPDLALNSFYTAVFILVIVIDLENRLILHGITLPVTILALLGSFIVGDNSFLSALVGLATGFVFFLAAYWLGRLLFGPGALGYGDVMLAMAMGAILGLHRVLFALVLAILLGGLGNGILLFSRRFGRRDYVPYGQYLAIAGIVMLIWGERIAAWYAR